MRLEEEAPTILLVSHGGLMRELYNILVAQTGAKNALKTPPPNTGIDQYKAHKMYSTKTKINNKTTSVILTLTICFSRRTFQPASMDKITTTNQTS